MTSTLLKPQDAVLSVLDRYPGMTTSAITGTLIMDSYAWPNAYPRVNAERVYSTLRALERRGLVERVRGQSPIRWRRPR